MNKEAKSTGTEVSQSEYAIARRLGAKHFGHYEAPAEKIKGGGPQTKGVTIKPCYSFV